MWLLWFEVIVHALGGGWDEISFFDFEFSTYIACIMSHKPNLTWACVVFYHIWEFGGFYANFMKIRNKPELSFKHD